MASCSHEHLEHVNRQAEEKGNQTSRPASQLPTSAVAHFACRSLADDTAQTSSDESEHGPAKSGSQAAASHPRDQWNCGHWPPPAPAGGLQEAQQSCTTRLAGVSLYDPPQA
eukprot:2436589-Prymnesium_polylepis.1